jgi:hypothetical protein
MEEHKAPTPPEKAHPDGGCQSCTHVVFHDLNGKQWYECHQRPPQVVVVGAIGIVRLETVWPKVYGSDWCSKWS